MFKAQQTLKLESMMTLKGDSSPLKNMRGLNQAMKTNTMMDGEVENLLNMSPVKYNRGKTMVAGKNLP